MTGALYDPTVKKLGIIDKMSAAKELLDRVGLVKTEKKTTIAGRSKRRRYVERYAI